MAPTLVLLHPGIKSNELLLNQNSREKMYLVSQLRLLKFSSLLLKFSSLLCSLGPCSRPALSMQSNCCVLRPITPPLCCLRFSSTALPGKAPIKDYHRAFSSWPCTSFFLTAWLKSQILASDSLARKVMRMDIVLSCLIK